MALATCLTVALALAVVGPNFSSAKTGEQAKGAERGAPDLDALGRAFLDPPDDSRITMRRVLRVSVALFSRLRGSSPSPRRSWRL
jgi:hypothetical protein